MILSYSIKIWAELFSVLSQSTHLTDGRMTRPPCIQCNMVKMLRLLWFIIIIIIITEIFRVA